MQQCSTMCNWSKTLALMFTDSQLRGAEYCHVRNCLFIFYANPYRRDKKKIENTTHACICYKLFEKITLRFSCIIWILNIEIHYYIKVWILKLTSTLFFLYLTDGQLSKGVNQVGIDYYNALIDELVANGLNFLPIT